MCSGNTLSRIFFVGETSDVSHFILRREGNMTSNFCISSMFYSVYWYFANNILFQFHINPMNSELFCFIVSRLRLGKGNSRLLNSHKVP